MITETIRRNLQSSTRWLQPAAHKCIFPASSTVSQQPTALCQAPTGFLLLIAFNFIDFYCNHFDSNCQDFLPKSWFTDIYPCNIWRYGSTLSGTLSLLFSPSGTKALMRQFVANAPKAHESLSTEARRVPVQGTPIPLISVFIAIFRLGTVWNDLFLRK